MGHSLTENRPQIYIIGQRSTHDTARWCDIEPLLIPLLPPQNSPASHSELVPTFIYNCHIRATVLPSRSSLMTTLHPMKVNLLNLCVSRKEHRFTLPLFTTPYHPVSVCHPTTQSPHSCKWKFTLPRHFRTHPRRQSRTTRTSSSPTPY